MKYRASLAQLRADIAVIKAAAPTARFEMYDADEPDEFADVVSFGGVGGVDLIRLPRELEIGAWLTMINREVSA